MATLTITSENAGIKFESEDFEHVINGFTTRRDSGNTSLFILGRLGEYLEIKYSNYSSITVDGSAATSLNDLQDKLDELSVSGISDVILQDTTGNKALVNDDGQLHVVQEGKVDTGNSSSAPLAADAVFTGVSVETLPFAVIVVSVYSNVASATDGLDIQQSTDNVNWDFCDQFSIPAATGKTFSFQPQSKYLRIVYTNGSTLQTAFRLSTTLKKTYVKPSSHRIQDSIIDDDDAELTKSVLTGKTPSDIYKNVNVTEDGDLSISNNSSGLSIAEGNVTGKSFVHKFGNAPDFDQGDGEVTVWDGAEEGTAWEQMVYQYSSTADIDSISSSSGSDTQDIIVEGLDTNWAFVSQTATLNGQNRVALTTSLIRCFRAYNDNSTILAGHVFVYVNTTLGSGIPVDTTKIRAIIDPLNQQTEMAVYTVPAGKTGYIRDWYASTAGANRSSNYPIKLKTRLFGKIFRLKHVSALSDNGTSAYQHQYKEPEGPLPEKTDIEMTCEMTASGGTNGNISAGFDIVLVDN
jgi:hypothetical protein